MTSPEISPALLSLAASRAARALSHWSPQELDRVADAVVDALAADARRWGDDGLDGLADAATLRAGARVLHAEDAAAADQKLAWTALSERGGWWHAESPSRAIARTLFGGPGTGVDVVDGRTLSDDLAAEVWAGQLLALASFVAGIDGASDDASRALAWRRWSGALLVTLPWCGATLRVLLPAAAVERVVRASGRRAVGAPVSAHGPLVPVLQAVAAHATRLEVRLDAFEIDLGSLVSLREGDVLHVRHALDAPVRVCAVQSDADATPLCAAWLGQRDGALAIELARASIHSKAAEPARASSLS